MSSQALLHDESCKSWYPSVRRLHRRWASTISNSMENFVSLNAMNLGIGGDCVENVLWRAISLLLPSSAWNIVVQCRTNNISTDSPRDIVDCIIDVGTIFRRKSNMVNTIRGLIPHDECWLINRLLINRVNDILKYECHKNGFVFIVQDHGWTLPNGSLHCSLFYKDPLHLVEQGNVKLAKSIVSTLTAQNNQINFLFRSCNKLCSDVSKQFVPATISFSFKEDDFPPLTNVFRLVSKSGNCSNHVAARSIVVLSNVSGHVKTFLSF